MMCICMPMSLRLAIFPPAALTSQLRAAQQHAELTDWDPAQLAEEARARKGKVTPWTPLTGAPPPATRPQRRPSRQTPWTQVKVALKGATATHCLPHTTLCLTARDTPAHSPPSSGHTATPCTYGGTTRGHTGQTRV